MALTKLNFTKDWNNPADFPTIEVSEAAVRSDMQDLYDQTKVGVNKIATELEATTGAAQIGAVAPSGVTGTTVQAIINSLKAALDTKATSSQVSSDYETKADAANHITGVSLNESTGVFTFTRQNGSTFTIDTALEKIAVNFSYDTVNQRLVLTLKDGTTQYISLSDFITETEFINTSDIIFTLDNHKVSAKISDSYKNEIAGLKNSASTSAANAAASEANAGSYADSANASMTSAQSSAVSSANSALDAKSFAKGDTGTRQGEATDNAKYYSEQAAGSATASYDYVIQSQAQVVLAESWAEGSTGTRPGEDFNNAKYWAERAREVVSGGDMRSEVYDADDTVRNAGGIKLYVEDIANAKADKDTTYTKDETDTALGLKADKATTYTKTETDTALGLKADKDTTYTKAETDTLIGKVDSKLDQNGLGTVAGGKNLIDFKKASGVTNCKFDGTKWNTITPDTRTICYIDVRLFQAPTSGSYITILASSTRTESQRISLSFTPNSSYPYLYIRHNGLARDIGISYYTGNLDSSKTYVLSFYVTINGTGNYSFGDIQIEEGNTFTGYEPFYESNLALTRSKNIVNLVNPTMATTTIGTVTCTNNGDGTYTVNGTNNTGSPINFRLVTDSEIKAFLSRYKSKTLRVVGTPNASNGYRLIGQGFVTDGIGLEDRGNGFTFTVPNNIDTYATVNFRIYIPNGAVLNNVVFRPMITENLSATYDDFIEYGHYTQLDKFSQTSFERTIANETTTTVHTFVATKPIVAITAYARIKNLGVGKYFEARILIDGVVVSDSQVNASISGAYLTTSVSFVGGVSIGSTITLEVWHNNGGSLVADGKFTVS